MNPSLVISYQLLAVNDVPTLHALNEIAGLIGASPVTFYKMPIITCFSTYHSKLRIWIPKGPPITVAQPPPPPLSKTTANTAFPYLYDTVSEFVLVCL